MKLKLRGERVLLILDPVEERKVGSIIVSETHSERTRIGTIVEIGPEVNEYAVGNRVLISWYTGTRIHLIGVNFDYGELVGKKVDEDTLRVTTQAEIISEAIGE
jgi:co-chaperonin GroES (HSP10)